jgi:hypothetical protein
MTPLLRTLFARDILLRGCDVEGTQRPPKRKQIRSSKFETISNDQKTGKVQTSPFRISIFGFRILFRFGSRESLGDLSVANALRKIGVRI